MTIDASVLSGPLDFPALAEILDINVAPVGASGGIVTVRAKGTIVYPEHNPKMWLTVRKDGVDIVHALMEVIGVQPGVTIYQKTVTLAPGAYEFVATLEYYIFIGPLTKVAQQSRTIP